MAEKKQVYESAVIGLPPLHLVLGTIPSPDPENRRRLGKYPLKCAPEMEIPIKKLIAHLKENQK